MTCSAHLYALAYVPVLALAVLTVFIAPAKTLGADTVENAQIGIPRVERTDHHLLTMLSSELSNLLDLDLSLTWDRVGEPTADASGTVPANDGLRFAVGLGLEM